MTNPNPNPRWTALPVLLALLGAVAVGWHLRSTPLQAFLVAGAFFTFVIAVTEYVRRSFGPPTNPTPAPTADPPNSPDPPNIDVEWEQRAEEWRRRYM